MIWKILLASFLLTSLSVDAQTFAGESLEYDPAENRFFSSKNGASIVQRSANGTISYFGNGLLSSYGMEVMNNTLFAIAGSNIYGYDLDTEMQVMQIAIPGANFLNGMASDGNNRLWVTDFGAKKIHEIDVTDYMSPSSVVVVANTVTTPNGIVYDETGNRLLFVNWSSNAPIKQVDLSDYSVTTVTTTSVGNIDGIDNDSYGNFYISSWSPNRITKYDANFSNAEIITAPGISSPADICYAQEIDTLAIPNGNSTVTFVGFATQTGLEEEVLQSEISVFPNPVTQQSYIAFELSSAQQTNIKLLDMNGRVAYQIINEKLAAGAHRILFAGFEIASGQYLLVVETYAGSEVQKVFVK
jgi:sugar lactone lactonase YvrE